MFKCVSNERLVKLCRYGIDNKCNFDCFISAIGNFNEVVVVKAVKTLFSKAWKPLRLESAIIETCQLAEFETYTKELSDLFDQCFGCLLV